MFLLIGGLVIAITKLDKMLSVAQFSCPAFLLGGIE